MKEFIIESNIFHKYIKPFIINNSDCSNSDISSITKAFIPFGAFNINNIDLS